MSTAGPGTEETAGTLGESNGASCELRTIEDPNLVHWSACMRELSLHLLDAVENAINAGATRIELDIAEDPAADWLHLTIRDNGRGMNAEQLARIADPFYTTRTTRRVGLGIPLFKAAAEHCDGGLLITSEPGVGTTLQATFRHSHIDRAPLGDMVSTLMTILLFGFGDLVYRHQVGERAFSFDTADLRAELGNVPLSHPQVRRWLQGYIAEGEQSVMGDR